MAERRKNRKKREVAEHNPEEDKPTKLEYAVAKYLRSNLPVKKTTLLSHKVEYFIASKAIDCLLDSSWARSKGSDNVFTTRESVVEFMEGMLRHKFFHRARKVVVQKEPKKKKKTDKDDESSMAEDNLMEKDKRLKEKMKEKEKAKGKEKEEKGKQDSKSEKKEEETEGEKKKEKKKFKLDMHLEQLFVDGNEAYVWIYDPISAKAWIIGTLTVFGAIALCLFPLWPKMFRHYVYYLSVAAAGFLVIIVSLAIIRLIVFVLVWILTFGKHHIWLLPNLTEDVGFFESFWPLYKYEYKGSKQKGTKDKDEKERKNKADKRPGSGKEDSGSEQDAKGDGGNNITHEDAERDSDQGSTEKRSQESGDNGFEIVEREDLQQQGDSDES